VVVAVVLAVLVLLVHLPPHLEVLVV
jgi:hypothetical protein